MPIVSNNALNRELGEVKTRMDMHEERLRRMETKIDLLVETVAASRGSLKTLMTLGTVVAGASAIVTSVAHWLLGRH